jgi:hypothetical protein
VFDFDNGIDIFDLTAVTGLTAFSELAVTTVGTNVEIRYGGNVISVANAAGQIDAGDFVL